MLRRAPVAVLAALLLAPCAGFGQRTPPPEPSRVATSASITGTVVDEGGLPVAGAHITVAGTADSASSAGDGSFRLTGLAPGKATIVIVKNGFTPLEFDFDIAAGITVALKLTIESMPPPIAADSTRSHSHSDDAAGAVGTSAARKVTIRGVVTDASNLPIFGAVIEEASSSLRTMSDSFGRFRLQGVEPGLAFVRVRKIGFLAEYFPVTGAAGRAITATITLRPAGQTLARVEVNADAMNGDKRMRGYFERAAKGVGIFVDRTELVRRNATQLTDVLRGRNGINVYGQGPNGNVIAGRTLRLGGGQGTGICPLPLILDGVFVQLRDGLTIDRVVNVQDVRAIEVYTTGPQVPAELANGQTECGAIVVWTR